MDSLDGEIYCEVIALNVQRLDDKVKKMRLDAASKASRTLDHKDPVANGVVAASTEIKEAVLTIDGVEHNVHLPERWIKTIYHAIKRYKERYGVEAAATIVNRYVKAKEPINVYVKQGISRRSYGDRREKFIKMLLLYAVQNKLLNIS